MDHTALLSQQVPLALVIIYVHNFLKQKKWFPLVAYDTPRANHYFSILLTGIATLGIHFTWSTENHALLITGLDPHALAVGGWHWLSQFVFVKSGYNLLQGALNPPEAKTATPVVVVEKK